MTTILQKIVGAINALQLTLHGDDWAIPWDLLTQSDCGKSTPNAAIRPAFQQRPAK
jgi:hypothetical protein